MNMAAYKSCVEIVNFEIASKTASMDNACIEIVGTRERHWNVSHETSEITSTFYLININFAVRM